VTGYVLSVMYYVLRFCCRAVRAGRGETSGRALHRKAFWTAVSRLSIMRSTGVQNGSVVVPSVPDWGETSRRALHRKAFCTRVSRLSKMIAKLKTAVLNDSLNARSGCLSSSVSPKLAHEAVLAKPPYFADSSAQGMSKMRLTGVQNGFVVVPDGFGQSVQYVV